jgi:hypothetical protein
MAPHGKQMTPEEKQIIVALSQQGYSSYTIAELIHGKVLILYACVQFYTPRASDYRLISKTVAITEIKK